MKTVSTLSSPCRALAAVLCAAGLFAGASPAQALIFIARTSAAGTPGPGGDHVLRNSGAAPVQANSSHFGHTSVVHDNDPLSTQTTVQSSAFARADMNGIHLLTQASGVLADAEPYRSTSLAVSANARASFGDSFVIQRPTPGPPVLRTSMLVHFGLSGALGGYTRPAPLDPTRPGNSEARASWHADLSVWDSTAGTELGRLNLSQDCASYNGGSFNCSGDPLGGYSMSISVPYGNTVTLSLDGETWASASGGLYYGGDLDAYGVSDLGHTITWGGITNLRDETGQALSGYSALSAASGFDYVNAFPSAVPEPPAAALGLAGLGLLAWRRRRRDA